LYDTLRDTDIADEREDRFSQGSAVQSRKKDVKSREGQVKS
jgi:hypothetical protein